jgi:hypothetical protein
VVLFYLSISDFFGLLDASLILPGELYDFIFAGAIIYIFVQVLLRKRKIVIEKNTFSLWPYFLLMILAGIQAIYLQFQGLQSLGASISVFRELFYICTFFILMQFSFDQKKMIRLIVLLDIISVFVYALEILNGGPIFSTILHTQGLYEPIGGQRIWRSWTDLPVFEFFSVSYLTLCLLKKRYLYSSKSLDFTALLIIVLGIVSKLARTELFCVLLCMLFCYFVADGINVRQILKNSPKKILQVILVLLITTFLLYFFANGVFDRIWSGVLAVINVKDSAKGSSINIRVSTLQVRWNYLLDRGQLLFGIGPYSYKSALIVDPYDVYATNRGVLAPDSAYATFLIRYGIVGILIYMYGHIKNAVKLIKKNSKVSLSVAITLIVILIYGWSGYDAMGKQSFIKVGILFAICLGGKKDNYYVSKKSSQ